MSIFGMIRADTDPPIEIAEEEGKVGVERAALVFHDGHGEVEQQVRVEANQLGIAQKLHVAAVNQNHLGLRRGLERAHQREEWIFARIVLKGAMLIGAEEDREAVLAGGSKRLAKRGDRQGPCR